MFLWYRIRQGGRIAGSEVAAEMADVAAHEDEGARSNTREAADVPYAMAWAELELVHDGLNEEDGVARATTCPISKRTRRRRSHVQGSSRCIARLVGRKARPARGQRNRIR